MNPLENVPVGTTGEFVTTVTYEMTVAHVLNTMPAVYSTPTMVLHMEIAGTQSIAHLLPPDHVTVGMGINMRHLAATRVGATIRVTSVLTEKDDKTVTFAVEAWDGDRKVGDGTHRRGVINVAAFEKRFGVS